MPWQPYFDPSHRVVGAKRRVLLERRFLEHRLVLGVILTVGRVALPRSGRVSYHGFRDRIRSLTSTARRVELSVQRRWWIRVAVKPPTLSLVDEACFAVMEIPVPLSLSSACSST